jgi:osmotically-inducible protein OsmY
VSRSFRLQAEVFLLLVLFLAACGATTSRTTDDASTSTRVKIALLNDAQVGALRLDARTFQGTVTLSGVVKTPEQERQAIAVARKVAGVRDVKSALKIEPQ